MEEYKISNLNDIRILAELELVKKIRDAYQDVTTTSKTKRAIRERLTREFVEEYSKRSSFSEEEIRSIVDLKVAKERWIKEIEEEDLEEER